MSQIFIPMLTKVHGTQITLITVLSDFFACSQCFQFKCFMMILPEEYILSNIEIYSYILYHTYWYDKGLAQDVK